MNFRSFFSLRISSAISFFALLFVSLLLSVIFNWSAFSFLFKNFFGYVWASSMILGDPLSIFYSAYNAVSLVVIVPLVAILLILFFQFSKRVSIEKKYLVNIIAFFWFLLGAIIFLVKVLSAKVVI